MRIGFVYFDFVCVVYLSTLSEASQDSDDPDMNRNVSQLITSKGYPLEDHTVQTEDGYLLSVQRIPNGRRRANGRRRHAGKPPVLILHGLLLSASDFVINFPKQSLGFILADAGYDVWLGNSRGNTYSRRHIKYTTDDSEFWNFSFDQVAEYDVPAMIDYILNQTGRKKLSYIGHSQGTSSIFALLSEKPEYNEKVQVVIALAPVATVGFITSPIRLFAPAAGGLDLLTKVFGDKEFLPSDHFIKLVNKGVCDSATEPLCDNVCFLINGFDNQQLNRTRQGVYTAHAPAGSSVKSVAHYGQMVLHKRFLKYDYGLENFFHYKQLTPPEYDVTKITAPVALLWGPNDALADPTDVLLLKPKIKNLVSFFRVPLNLFAHLDFCIGEQANKLVYEEVLRLLKAYQ